MVVLAGASTVTIAPRSARAESGGWPTPVAPEAELVLGAPKSPTRSVGEVRRLVRQDDRAILAWCEALLESANPAARALALEGWRVSRDLPETVRRKVERLLGDEEPGTRLLAVDVLTRHGLGPSWPLVAALVEDAVREVRLSAIRAIAPTHETRTALVLLPARRDPDPEIRREVFRGLGAAGDAHALPFLREGLAETDPTVMRAALRASCALGDTTLVPRLVALTEHLALRSTGGDTLPGDAVARKTTLLARDAWLCLGDLATEEALRHLTRALREHPAERDAEEGLARAGERAWPWLAAEAKRGTPAAASKALRVLGTGPGACERFDPDWLDRETGVALAALEALRPCTAPAIRATVVSRFARWRSPHLRAAALALIRPAAGEVPSALPSPEALRPAWIGEGFANSGLVRAEALALAAAVPALREGARSFAWQALAALRAGTEEDLAIRRAALALLASAPTSGDVEALLAVAPRQGERWAEDWARALAKAATVRDRRILDAAIDRLTALADEPALMAVLAVEARLNREAPLGPDRRATFISLMALLVADREPPAPRSPAVAAAAATALADAEVPASLAAWAGALAARTSPSTRAALEPGLRRKLGLDRVPADRVAAGNPWP